jgi:hypothetical protein
MAAMNWRLLDAPKGKFFITSDSPVSVLANRALLLPEPSLQHPAAQVVFPITPSTCLFLSPILRLGENALRLVS